MFTTDSRILNTDKYYKAVIVGGVKKGENKKIVHKYLDELAFLARTAGAKSYKRFLQNIKRPRPKTYIGKGKLKEIKEYIDKYKIKLIIFDDELSGSQINNIKDICQCMVLDRTDLILDIFSKRAQTAQAKLQVELAKLQYIRPRLKHMWPHLGRQHGGIGSRGPGEKEIEKDRRLLNKRITLLKRKLKKRQQQNATQRKQRGEFVRIALVGYTNVGKTTVLNQLADEDQFAENKLFATLDTRVRRVAIKSVPFLLSDTVGFIRKLPHHLIESFKTTLAEAQEADLLLHVVDVSQEDFEDSIEVVNQTLKELDAHNKETILLFNKIDRYRKKMKKKQGKAFTDNGLEHFKESWMSKLNGQESVFISALNGENIGELRDILYKKVKKIYQQRYPYKAEFYA